MAALPGVLHRPLRHERGHQLALLEEDFGEGLEQVGAVRCSKRICHRQRAFPHTGAGLAMQRLQRTVERVRVVHQAGEQIGFGRCAQHRVAEVAGCQRLQIPIAFRAYAVRRFVEHEELVLEPELDLHAARRRLCEDAAQSRARTQRMIAAVGRDELAEEKRRAGVGHPSQRVGDELEMRIRIAGVPAGVTRVVVQLVRDVPSENTIAEAATVAEQAVELVEAHVLAADHAVDVGQPQFDAGDAFVAKRLQRRLGVIDHGVPRCVGIQSCRNS